MLASLGLIFPLIKSFLGENLIEKMLAHRQALAASANERELGARSGCEGAGL
jgi:hypothetical protein